MPGVALVTAYNDQGELLLGRRNDNGKWTVPGGHLEEGEDPRAGAERELMEETGLRPKSLSFLRQFETVGGLVLYCFSAYVRGEPHSDLDPDDEVGEWKFVDVSEGLPSRYFNNLHGPDPESGDNLVTNLFDIEKAEDVVHDLAKYEDRRFYTLDDVGLATNEFGGDKAARDMITVHAGHDNPMFRMVDHNVDELHTLGTIPSKMEFLRRTPAAAEAPIVVGHGNAVLDGNHRVELHRELGKTKVRGYQLVDEMQKAALDPSAGYRLEHKNLPPQNGGTLHQTHVTAYAPDGSRAGYAEIWHHPGGYLQTDVVSVRPEHQRRGLAGAMYALAERVTGKKMKPGYSQSPEAEALWADPNRQFGKAESRFRDGDMYVTFEFPTEEQAEAYHKEAQDRYEDEWKGIGVVARSGRRVVVRAWNESNMDDFRHLVKKMGGRSVDADDLDDEVAPEAFRKHEVEKLLQHPDPVERRMALRLDSVEPGHLAAAALDPLPAVHEAAIDHPLFGDAEALALMNAREGSDGLYPAAQQAAFLRRAGRAGSHHIAAAVANATQVSPEARDAVLAAVVPHEALSHDNIREIFHGPYASDDHRLALLGRDVDVPDDVLQSVVRGVAAFPSEGASKLALAAFTHPLFNPADRDQFVTSIGEATNPSLAALAQSVLRAAPVGAAAAEHLHLHARLRPSPLTVGLLGAFLAGPGATPGDVDRALATGNHDLLGPASQSSAIQPQHFDQIVDRAGKAGDAQLLTALQAHQGFRNHHLAALMTPVAKSQLDQLVEMANHPIVDRQLGLDPLQIPAFRAARFLADGRAVPAEAARAALYEDDGDVEAAALRAYGLEVTEDNRAALRAVQDVGDFGKMEVDPTPNAQEVSAPHPEGRDVAAAVARAYEKQFVVPVKLGGKHSKGSLLAHDDDTGTTWLLKSGSGGAGVAAGSSEDPSNPNAREAAWYQLALAWGVADHYPRAEEVLIDGHPYAALKLLPWAYQSLEKMRQKDPGAPARVLAPYLASGKLHEWAVMDYVFGNPDSHGENVMADPTEENHERRRHFQHSEQQVDSTKDVQLIDHGSAFAGDEFDPAHDRASFVPFYLRAWAPHTNFNQLPLEEKLKYLPRVHGEVAQRLTTWIEGRKPDEVRVICSRYGIDPEPTLRRLEKLQALAKTVPVDEAVDRLWATT